MLIRTEELLKVVCDTCKSSEFCMIKDNCIFYQQVSDAIEKCLEVKGMIDGNRLLAKLEKRRKYIDGDLSYTSRERASHLAESVHVSHVVNEMLGVHK